MTRRGLAALGGAGGRRIRAAGQPVRRIRFSAQAGIEHDPNGTFHIDQAYVQSFVPEAAGSRPPLVLVHGGCLTGAMWETTPDERPGWLEIFLLAGFPVYVVDGVERGRAGWCSVPGIWPEAPVARSAEEMWSLYRLGPEGSTAPFSGQRFPVRYFDTLLMQHMPRWFSTIPAASEALVAVLERIRPALVVSGLICIEPSGFPEEPPPVMGGIPALMIDNNSAEIAAEITGWLAEVYSGS